MTCVGVTWPGRKQSMKLGAGLQACGSPGRPTLEAKQRYPLPVALPAGGAGPSLAVSHQTHSTGDASSEPTRGGGEHRNQAPAGPGKGQLGRSPMAGRAPSGPQHSALPLSPLGPFISALSQSHPLPTLGSSWFLSKHHQHIRRCTHTEHLHTPRCTRHTACRYTPTHSTWARAHTRMCADTICTHTRDTSTKTEAYTPPRHTAHIQTST